MKYLKQALKAQWYVTIIETTVHEVRIQLLIPGKNTTIITLLLHNNNKHVTMHKCGYYKWN